MCDLHSKRNKWFPFRCEQMRAFSIYAEDDGRIVNVSVAGISPRFHLISRKTKLLFPWDLFAKNVQRKQMTIHLYLCASLLHANNESKRSPNRSQSEK